MAILRVKTQHADIEDTDAGQMSAKWMSVELLRPEAVVEPAGDAPAADRVRHLVQQVARPQDH